jgi:hypothetical protein
MTGRGVGAVTLLAFVMVALVSASGCEGESFTPESNSASGGSSMTGGGSDGGGEAGTGGRGGGGSGGTTGGSGGTAGNTSSGGRSGASTGGADGGGGQGDAGAGGEPPCNEGTDCPAGRYCDAQGVCELCTDITTLDDPGAARFGAPEPLSVLNDAAGDFLLRTPRVFGTENALLYVRDFFGGEIWLTGDMDNDVGAPLSSPVNEPNFLEGSPLWLTRDDGVFRTYNFVFNRADGAIAPHEFYAAGLEANGVASSFMRLPAPFNSTDPPTESAYSMAVSRDRAWWMVNRDLMLALQFLTAPIDQAGPPSVVPLPYSENCNIVEFDLGAWVTPDGKLLFVNALERTPECMPLTGEPHDVVMFRLNEAGQALGPAVPVSGVSQPEANEIDASLSVDMCSLYFVTNSKDKLRIMRARREG